MPQVIGGAALSGIGFTISLFIVDLALTDPVLQDQARVGVFTASLIAAGLGALIFFASGARPVISVRRWSCSGRSIPNVITSAAGSTPRTP